MSQKSDGMNYAPQGKPSPVVKPGEFIFAAVHLDHGHINGQCNGLVEAGGQLKWVYDADTAKAEALAARFPGAKVARSLDEVLADPAVQLVAAAAIHNIITPTRINDIFTSVTGKNIITTCSPIYNTKFKPRYSLQFIMKVNSKNIERLFLNLV